MAVGGNGAAPGGNECAPLVSAARRELWRGAARLKGEMLAAESDCGGGYDACARLAEESPLSGATEQIDRDADGRTFCGLPEALRPPLGDTPGAEACLRRVLLAWTARSVRRHLGATYVQGMSFVAALAIAVLGSDDEAAVFALLCVSLEQVLTPPLYASSPPLAGLHVAARIAAEEAAARAPGLPEALGGAAELQAVTRICCLRWLLSGFSNALPAEALLGLWDTWLAEWLARPRELLCAGPLRCATGLLCANGARLSLAVNEEGPDRAPGEPLSTAEAVSALVSAARRVPAGWEPLTEDGDFGCWDEPAVRLRFKESLREARRRAEAMRVCGINGLPQEQVDGLREAFERIERQQQPASSAANLRVPLRRRPTMRMRTPDPSPASSPGHAQPAEQPGRGDAVQAGIPLEAAERVAASTHPGFPTEALRRLFALIDVDRSGTLDFFELMVGLQLLAAGSGAPEKLRLLFQLFDSNGSGQLTEEELLPLAGTLLRIGGSITGELPDGPDAGAGALVRRLLATGAEAAMGGSPAGRRRRQQAQQQALPQPAPKSLGLDAWVDAALSAPELCDALAACGLGGSGGSGPDEQPTQEEAERAGESEPAVLFAAGYQQVQREQPSARGAAAQRLREAAGEGLRRAEGVRRRALIADMQRERALRAEAEAVLLEAERLLGWAAVAARALAAQRGVAQALHAQGDPRSTLLGSPSATFSSACESPAGGAEAAPEETPPEGQQAWEAAERDFSSFLRRAALAFTALAEDTAVQGAVQALQRHASEAQQTAAAASAALAAAEAAREKAQGAGEAEAAQFYAALESCEAGCELPRPPPPRGASPRPCLWLLERQYAAAVAAADAPAAAARLQVGAAAARLTAATSRRHSAACSAVATVSAVLQQGWADAAGLGAEPGATAVSSSTASPPPAPDAQAVPGDLPETDTGLPLSSLGSGLVLHQGPLEHKGLLRWKGCYGVLTADRWLHVFESLSAAAEGTAAPQRSHDLSHGELLPLPKSGVGVFECRTAPAAQPPAPRESSARLLLRPRRGSDAGGRELMRAATEEAMVDWLVASSTR